jgi:hypothetical protein
MQMSRPLFSWQTEVGFFDTWEPPRPVLLGQVGFFDHFTVSMSHSAQALAVEPWNEFDQRFGALMREAAVGRRSSYRSPTSPQAGLRASQLHSLVHGSIPAMTGTRRSGRSPGQSAITTLSPGQQNCWNRSHNPLVAGSSPVDLACEAPGQSQLSFS